MEYGTGRCGNYDSGLPEGTSVPAGCGILCIDDLSGIFAFTTILGWDYYGERCLEYLFNKNMKAVRAYRWLYIICVFIGPYMTVAAVWNIADIFNALMAIPNLIALLALSKVIVKENESIYGKAECGREESENSQRNECRECIIEYKFCRAYGDKIQGFGIRSRIPVFNFCPLI